MAEISSPGEILHDILTGNFQDLSQLVAPTMAVIFIPAAAGDMLSTFFGSPAGNTISIENLAALTDVLA